MKSLILTDSPRVVALKREFYHLSLEDAELQEILYPGVLVKERIAEIRQRKLVIATEVFNHAELGNHETRNSEIPALLHS